MDKYMSDVDVAFWAAVIALASLAISAVTLWWTQKHESKVQRASAYLELELASIEIFRSKPDYYDALRYVETDELPAGQNADFLSDKADQFFYQCLNLFEVASRFRKVGIVEPEIYGSWVAWFYEVLEFKFFRRRWEEEYHDNYTAELRSIFDLGVGLDWQSPDDNARRRKFYLGVGDIIERDDPKGIIRSWPLEDRKVPQETRTRTDALASLRYYWNRKQDVAAAAEFAGAEIPKDSGYISHGEIQTGLSVDGRSWAPDLGELFAADFAAHDGKDLLVARDRQGKVKAILVLGWEESPRLKYAVIEDMAVAEDLRAHGVGGALIDRALDRVRKKGREWVFLESGLGNKGAHGFFEHRGFEPVSKVFARKLT